MVSRRQRCSTLPPKSPQAAGDQVLARWDTPKVVKGVSFMLRRTVAADDGSERLVSTARTTETTYRFRQLALGCQHADVWGGKCPGGSRVIPASVSFRIAAPAAPVTIELIPGYFQITAVPKLAVYDPTVQFEFWLSEKRIIDIRQVELTARYLGTALYWIASGPGSSRAIIIIFTFAV